MGFGVFTRRLELIGIIYFFIQIMLSPERFINNIVILDNNIGALTKLLVFLFITALLMHFTTFFCSCLSITYHVFLPSCMQPAGSYAKVTNMINKIIAGFLGDDQEEVTLLQWWRVVL